MAGEKDQNDTGAQGLGQAQPPVEKITVGDKSYSANDVQSMLAAQAEATRVLQQFSEVQKAAQRYGVSPIDFVRQAEGSFAAVSDLIDKKIIDEQGNLLQKGALGDDEGDDDLLALLGVKETPPQGPAATPPGAPPGAGKTKALLRAFQEIKGSTGQLAREVEQLKKDNAALLRYNLATKLQASFPELVEEDVNLVLERARGDRTKSLAEHAKLVVEKRRSVEDQARKALAKQLGIEDLDNHLNSLKQQKEGGIGTMFQGKKISFKPKDANSVHPREAAEAYLKAALRR
jgi:hypothetical protein